MNGPSEIERAEEALKLSEARYRAIVSHTPNVAMQGYDAEGRVVFWNPASETIFGWKESEALGKTAGELMLTPEEGADFARCLREIARTGTAPPPHEYTFIRKDGSCGVCLSSLFPIPGESGDLHFVCTDIDITARKEAEKALEESRRVLATLVSNLPGMVYRCRNNGELTMTFVSEGCKELTGYERDELEGNRVVSYGDLIHPDDAGWLRDKWRSSLEARVPCSHEYRIIDKAGKIRWVAERAAGIYDEHGTLLSVEGFVRDISERKRSEMLSSGQNRILKMIAIDRPLPEVLDALTAWIEGLCPDTLCSVLLVDDDGVTLRHGSGGSLPVEFCRAVDGNRSCDGAGSCGTAVTRGTRIVCADVATDPLWTNYKELALSHGLRACWSTPIFSTSQQVIGSFANYYREVRAPGAEEIQWVDVACSLAGVAIDRARFQAQLKRFNAELEQRVAQRTSELEVLNKELEAFSYSVSHDLRAPLRHLTGFSQLLSAQPSVAGDAVALRMADTISKAAIRMGRLVDDLLVFSRMGRTPLRKQPVNLDQLLAESRTQLQAEAPDRDVMWRIQPLPTVLADPTMLRQVLLNLVGNALKYTRPKPQAIIEISCERRDGEWMFMIRDNGVGFEMKFVDRLFGVFQRLHRDDEFEGTGIGLANVRRIIARHGGKTWAESRLNEGATFYFSLPVDGGEEPRDGNASTPS